MRNPHSAQEGGKVAQKPVLGLLGGIASGKSTVAKLLAKHRGAVVGADEITHRILDEADVRARVTARWGKAVLGDDGRIDRRRLADCAFESRESVRDLNAIAHPAVLDEMRREIAAAQRRTDVDFIVIDAALLVEAGQQDLCDVLVFVDADPAERARRIQGYRHWKEGELQRRESFQQPLVAKRDLAQHVIANNGSLDDLEREVDALVARLAGRAS
jgi:dephospho-CoA kinase